MIDYPDGQPCWAPGAADYLASILTGDEIAFEWGSGASTIWLADRIESVFAMEHDLKWVTKLVESETEGSIRPFHYAYTNDEYVTTALRCTPQPNLWLIDGMRRIDCLALVEKHAKEGDIVVLDDAMDYARHLVGVQYFAAFTMPHPHAGIPINHAKYGHQRNTNQKVHPPNKETWICKTWICKWGA